MRQQTRRSKEPAEKVVQDIRRATRKQYSAEEMKNLEQKLQDAMDQLDKVEAKAPQK